MSLNNVNLDFGSQVNIGKLAEVNYLKDNPVIEIYKIIASKINDFQKLLDDEHEIGVQLASFNQNILMHITHISYSAPTLINFYGFVNGNKAHLIQHINQLNFLILSVPKEEPDKPARRVGFNVSDSQV